MTVLEVEDIKKIYRPRFGGNQVQALSKVTFSVEEGEYVSIMGESGSGKTTLLKNLLENMEGTKVGVIQNELGKISIDGTVLQNDDIHMVELNRGSIFCSCLRLSFVDALAKMSQQGLDMYL